MNNNLKKEFEKIELPSELRDKVKAGIQQAKSERQEDVNLSQTSDKTKRKQKQYNKLKVSCMTAAALFGITFSSGFVSPTMNQVLATTPVVGGIFEQFGDKLGFNLAKQQLVTALNETATNNGVNVALTNVYFDGGVVSVTGHVSGDLHKGNNEKGELSFDVNFDNNEGDNDPWLRGLSTATKKTADGYDFQWKMHYPDETIKEAFSLPITIHYINGIKGAWKFDVPVTQGEGSTIAVHQSKSYPADGLQLNIKEINTAKASSTLEYETVSKYKGDQLMLSKAVDEEGNNVLENINGRQLADFEAEDGFHQIYRSMMSKLEKETESITFYPFVSIKDPVVEQSLNSSSFTLNSERTDLAVKINSVTKEANKLILDYEFQGFSDGISDHFLDTITHNLSYAFTLVDQAYVDDIDPENPVPPENHSITRNEVELLNKEKLHYRSVFQLDGERTIENFSLEDTVLRFNFNSFIHNKELEPFTVKLTSEE